MELSIAETFERIAAAIPDREAVVFRERRLTYRNLDERANRLANALLARGVSLRQSRRHLQNWESGHDHVALYLLNGNEYLEGMLAAFKARAASVNINYRYRAEELAYLLRDSQPRAIVYHARFAPVLAEVLDQFPNAALLAQVADDSQTALLRGAVDYEELLLSSSSAPPPTAPSPDDAYLLYTGGTTGMPKAVIWRQADLAVAALGLRDPDTGAEFESIERLVTLATRRNRRVLPAPPMMHGGAQWTSLQALLEGATVVVQDAVDHLDPGDLWRTIDREYVNLVLIVGDAFARPLLDELDGEGDYNLESLRLLVTGGVVMSSETKARIIQRLPSVRIVDSGGASETGGQLRQDTGATNGKVPGFRLLPDAHVLSPDRRRILPDDSDEIGWLGKSGRIPLGYLNDAVKTEQCFPTVAGQRMSVPGDRVQHRPAGTVSLLGRDAITINTGGEKVFAEEVEEALRSHPAVYDAVVTGRPSERWGSEIVAVVQVEEHTSVTDGDLRAWCESRIARYKVPKAILRVDQVLRGPTGKADYRWAARIAQPVAADQ